MLPGENHLVLLQVFLSFLSQFPRFDRALAMLRFGAFRESISG